jgi:hypothetical protein
MYAAEIALRLSGTYKSCSNKNNQQAEFFKQKNKITSDPVDSKIHTSRMFSLFQKIKIKFFLSTGT